MSAIVRSTAARVGVRIGGAIAGFIIGLLLLIVSSVVASVLGSMLATYFQIPVLNPLSFALLGWVAAEILIWVAVRREPALPDGARPEMPDRLPRVEPPGRTWTRYPRNASALPELPARTPDPVKKSKIRDLAASLRDEFSVEVAYQAVDAERRPVVEAFVAHEKSLLEIARTAERNAAVILTIVLGLFLPAALFSGLRLALAVLVFSAVTWIATKIVRRRVIPSRRRPGAREAGEHQDFTTVVPFVAEGSVGGNLSAAVAEFGQGLVDMGTAGEIRTARLLDSSLAGITRVAVFHSLRFPELDRADVDHVVLTDTSRGPVLIIVDSKAWKPGTWTQTSGGTVRHEESGEERSSIMPLAVEKFAKAGFPSRAMTVIHASSRSVVVNPRQDDAHSFVDSESLIHSILTERNSAPVIRGDTDPQMVRFLELRKDLEWRLVRA